MIGQILQALEGALPSIAAAVVIGVVTHAANTLKKSGTSIKTIIKEHRFLVKQQAENTKAIKALSSNMDSVKSVLRNDVKSHIVSIYERCIERGQEQGIEYGCITPMELETVNRLNDSYHNTLSGNTYIHVIVDQMNTKMTIKGTEIPEH